PMTTTKAKLEFVHAMARHTRATVRQCEALMRYAATLQRLAEDDCNIPTNDAGLDKRDRKRTRIYEHINQVCAEINFPVSTPLVAIFSNDPRGAVLKIRVPDGYTDDFGGEGICVPA